MSCIAGAFAFGDRPVASAHIDSMLAAVQRRAPDGTTCFARGPVAAGRAYLRTGRSAPEGPHPVTLDGTVWIVADARIDGRAALVRELAAAGRGVDQDATHGELILHAYAAFGDRFLEHLEGDFAFLLWDEPRQRLVGARDAFGVRPLYWTRTAEALWFASDIASLREVPGLDPVLDPASVADFLLLGMCTEAEQTIFRDIRCVAPGTRIDVQGGQVGIRRHWSVPRDLPAIRYRDREDYVSHFAQLFSQAVADRLPGGPVCTHLSGGMDSTAIAACAVRALGPGAVSACHFTTRSVEPADDEEALAALVAQHLGIGFASFDVAARPLFDHHDRLQLRTAFPIAYAHLAASAELSRHVLSTGARVVLSGYSGDAVMSPDPEHAVRLLRRGRLAAFAQEAIDHLKATRSLRGLGLRGLLQPVRPPKWLPPFPDWVAGHALGVDPQQRWERWWSAHLRARAAADQLSTPWIQRQFEAAEVLPAPIVYRYPFHDARLVRFLLAVPSHVVREKWVLRRAMRAMLPPAICERPKTAAAGDYLRALVEKGAVADAAAFATLEGIPGIDARCFRMRWDEYRGGAGTESTWSSWLLLNPLALGVWLREHCTEATLPAGTPDAGAATQMHL